MFYKTASIHNRLDGSSSKYRSWVWIQMFFKDYMFQFLSFVKRKYFSPYPIISIFFIDLPMNALAGIATDTHTLQHVSFESFLFSLHFFLLFPQFNVVAIIIIIAVVAVVAVVVAFKRISYSCLLAIANDNDYHQYDYAYVCLGVYVCVFVFTHMCSLLDHLHIIFVEIVVFLMIVSLWVSFLCYWLGFDPFFLSSFCFCFFFLFIVANCCVCCNMQYYWQLCLFIIVIVVGLWWWWKLLLHVACCFGFQFQFIVFYCCLCYLAFVL